MDRIKALKENVLFSQFDNSELEYISGLLEEKDAHMGEMIFEEGMECDGMYLIQDGLVEVFRIANDPDKTKRMLSILQYGEFFGEMALLDKLPRSTSVIALEHTKLLKMSISTFEELTVKKPAMAFKMILQISKSMSNHIRKMNNSFMDLIAWGINVGQQVENMKKDFLAAVSHELRTPLYSIQGFSELLQDTSVDDETKKDLAKIVLTESDRLSRLVNDLISLSQMEYGGINLSKKLVDVKKIFQRVINEYLPDIEKKKISLESNMTENACAFNGDELKLRQAFYNVLDNAVKFTNESGKISVKLTDENNEYKIFVEDNGIGIPEEAMDKIFYKFFQVDQTKTRNVGGSGIGLTLTKEIIEMHGGQIRVESKLNVGTKVEIKLPKNV